MHRMTQSSTDKTKSSLVVWKIIEPRVCARLCVRTDSSEKRPDSDCNFIGGDYRSFKQMSSLFSFKKKGDQKLSVCLRLPRSCFSTLLISTALINARRN